MVELYPIVKLDAKETYEVFRVVPVKCIVVRLQDLISKITFDFNKTYHDITVSGGLHGFLGFTGHILLSLIMKDEIVANFQPHKYATAINALLPDSCTTIDGETYEGDYRVSSGELARIHSNNTELISLCPNCRYIGLVKGCSENQIEHHRELLESLGIEDFVFHIGDFFRHGDPNMIRKARSYSWIIREHATRLFLYGMGSQNRLLEFSFADAYISFTHFVTAKNGMEIIGTKKVKYGRNYEPAIMISNFIQMYKNVGLLKEQSRLY